MQGDAAGPLARCPGKTRAGRTELPPEAASGGHGALAGRAFHTGRAPYGSHASGNEVACAALAPASHADQSQN